MGARSLASLLVGLAGLVSAYGGISLQPHESTYTLEGIKLRQLGFFDGGKEITYQQPPDWSYSGTSDRLILHPPGKSQAEAIISRASANEGAKENATPLAEATASAPQGSTDLRIISQAENSVKINGKESFQVVMTYNLQGQTFSRSIVFLNRDHEQLRFQLTTREGDFKDLNRAFQGSLCTWQNL